MSDACLEVRRDDRFASRFAAGVSRSRNDARIEPRSGVAERLGPSIDGPCGERGRRRWLASRTIFPPASGLRRKELPFIVDAGLRESHQRAASWSTCVLLDTSSPSQLPLSPLTRTAAGRAIEDGLIEDALMSDLRSKLGESERTSGSSRLSLKHLSLVSESARVPRTWRDSLAAAMRRRICRFWLSTIRC